VPLSIQNKTKRPLPRVRFEKIAEHILGKSFEASLVFIGSTLSRKLNRTHRGKDKATNVLSFPLSKSSGEIFMDLSKIEKEVAKFGMPYKKLVAYLFIHACLHLKGMSHGAKMEKLESKLLNGASNHRWY
jgi:probable rRNA maturation factor